MKPAISWPDGGLQELETSVHAPTQHSNATRYAPPWTERISDRIAWCKWLLEAHPEIYRAFRVAADSKRAGNLEKRIGVDAILQGLRWDTGARAEGDGFKLNNNARALLARLYLLECPEAKLETRKSWLDTLTSAEWERITAVWKRDAA
jgi:hypothetical protein